MASVEKLYGRVALGSGLTALFITTCIAYFTGSAPVPDFVPQVELGMVGFIVTMVVVGLLSFAVPALCVAALFFGNRAKGLWIARIGIGAAAISLLAYVQFIRSWFWF